MAKFYTPTRLSENIRETPEGFLLCLGVPIARTGIQVYGEGETPLEALDGKVEVQRDSKEVFDPITIASFEGKSITIKHPKDFVTPENWSYLSKGIVQNVRKGAEKGEGGEESLLADLLITDSFAIQLVKAGLREVSCGYEAEYEQTEKGKGRQTKIIGNHLALVEEGRAGSTYAINDHKGKVTMSKKLAEKIKALLGKTVDEAMEKEGGEKEAKATDKEAFDELVKAVKDLMTHVEGMKKVGDEDEEEKKDDKSKDDDDDQDKAKDDDDQDKAKDDDEGESEILERVKALEAAVAKLLELEEKEQSEDDDEEKEESEDDEEEESEKKKHLSGDSKKKTGLEKTKDAKFFDQFDNKTEIMTAEKMNELNAAHWARK
jgi:hypothetical protein